MNKTIFLMIVMIGGANPLFAGSRSGGNSTINDTTDAGGQRSTSANYTVDGSVGGIGGISSGGSDMAKQGYAGQLTEVTHVAVTATPDQLVEGSTRQLTAMATLDDQTITALTGQDVAWNAVAYPFQSLDGNGVLTALANVYSSPTGVVSGAYLGVFGSTIVQVLGPYAGSGISDAWFVQYFGTAPNPLANPNADASGTGQNNLFKYVAGLNPTNAASRFVLDIASVAGQSGEKNLVFSPYWNDRTYTLLYRTNLLSGSWSAVTGTTSNNGVTCTVTDPDATDKSRFYEIQISY